jgi:type IV pilus assembly protein PilA
MVLKERQNGFTLIELMVVVAIIAGLAAIALPKFIQYRQKSYDSSAAADIKNAYTASQAYFTDYIDATLTLPKLKAAGYRQSDYVDMTILDDQADTLKLEAGHTSGYKIYSVDSSGRVTYHPES